jgi:hypothetical protein
VRGVGEHVHRHGSHGPEGVAKEALGRGRAQRQPITHQRPSGVARHVDQALDALAGTDRPARGEGEGNGDEAILSGSIALNSFPVFSGVHQGFCVLTPTSVVFMKACGYLTQSMWSPSLGGSTMASTGEPSFTACCSSSANTHHTTHTYGQRHAAIA